MFNIYPVDDSPKDMCTRIFGKEKYEYPNIYRRNGRPYFYKDITISEEGEKRLWEGGRPEYKVYLIGTALNKEGKENAVEPYYNEETIASFKLTAYPDNCGIILLSDMSHGFVKHKGFGSKLLKLAESIAESMGYSNIQASVNNSTQNQHFLQMAKKRGWNVVYSFINDRSESEITILTKVLIECELGEYDDEDD